MGIECTDSQLANNCYTVEAWPAMYESIMSGGTMGTVEICGKQGGQPFQKVVRPNTIGECPEGTTPCNPNSSAESTVCYPAASHDSSCPITDLLFIDKDKLEDYPDYDSEEFNPTTLIVWSKETDNLPVTTIRLDTA